MPTQGGASIASDALHFVQPIALPSEAEAMLRARLGLRDLLRGCEKFARQVNQFSLGLIEAVEGGFDQSGHRIKTGGAPSVGRARQGITLEEA